MKLKQALEIGQSCELDTVDEAIFNIKLHAINLFNYGEEKKEYEELVREFLASGLRGHDTITKALQTLK